MRIQALKLSQLAAGYFSFYKITEYQGQTGGGGMKDMESYTNNTYVSSVLIFYLQSIVLDKKCYNVIIYPIQYTLSKFTVD